MILDFSRSEMTIGPIDYSNLKENLLYQIEYILFKLQMKRASCILLISGCTFGSNNQPSLRF